MVGLSRVCHNIFSLSLKRNRRKSGFSTVGILIKSNFDMKKRTVFVGAILSVIPLVQLFGNINIMGFTNALILPSFASIVNEENASFYYDKGIQKMNVGDYQGSISDLTKAININPKFSDAYTNRGYAKYLSGDLDGAISDLNKAIKLDPNSAIAFSNRCAILPDKNKFLDAKKRL